MLNYLDLCALTPLVILVIYDHLVICLSFKVKLFDLYGFLCSKPTYSFPCNPCGVTSLSYENIFVIIGTLLFYEQTSPLLHITSFILVNIVTKF